jgi:hypothetical protein
VLSNVETDRSDLLLDISLRLVSGPDLRGIMNGHEAHEMLEGNKKPSKLKVRGNALIAFPAIEFATEARCSAFFREHPFTSSERRVMPDVLVMAAFEFRPPVSLIVRVKTDYPSLHRLGRAASSSAGGTPPEKYR